MSMGQRNPPFHFPLTDLSNLWLSDKLVSQKSNESSTIERMLHHGWKFVRSIYHDVDILISMILSLSVTVRFSKIIRLYLFLLGTLAQKAALLLFDMSSIALVYMLVRNREPLEQNTTHMNCETATVAAARILPSQIRNGLPEYPF